MILVNIAGAWAAKCNKGPFLPAVRGFLRVAVLVMVLTTVFPLPVAKAQQPWNCQGSLRDLDNDGWSELIVLSHCQFATEDDTIYIYDEMEAGQREGDQDLWARLDFVDSIWSFDAGSDGQVDLRIEFHRDQGALVADLYDRYHGDLPDPTGEPGESQGRARWTVRVLAPDGWWLLDDRVNFDLQILVDGPVVAIFDAPVYLDELLTDGEIDFTVSVHDVDRDGRPDYELIQSDAMRRAQRSLIKTFLIVNDADSEWPLQDSLFWPYLGSLSYRFIKPYEASPPPIQIDWSAGRIVAVGEFVASHGGETNWYIQSTAAFGLERGMVYANFENPYAFYDLAEDRDGYPELIVRTEYYGPNDPNFLGGFFSKAVESIRYSWDQDNDWSWDYDVELLGRHEITTTVDFPDFQVRTVPHDLYLDWVREQAWDACTFVSVENLPSYGSSEGIYEGAVREWRDLYLTGFANEVDWQSVQDIRQGLRREYTPELRGQPWLYFSPIDRRLHLLNAQGGVWNVDESQRERYEDLDGDGYLDRWTFTEKPAAEAQEQTLKTLQVAGDLFIYGDDRQVRIVRSQVAPSLFETLPPHNHQEWLALGEQLERDSAQFGPGNFLDMLAQLQGPLTQVEGAALEDFRLSEGGFRFVLELEPDFVVRADANGLGWEDLDPGPYIVEYNGVFSTRSATLPRVSLPESSISADPARPTQMAWTTIQAIFYNAGLRDVASLPVQVYAAHEGSAPVLLAEYDLFLPGEGQASLRHEWIPLEPGDWTISIEVDAEIGQQQNIEVGPLAELKVYVQPETGADFFLPSTGFDLPTFTWPVALFWGSVVLVAGSVVLLLLRYSRSRQNSTPSPPPVAAGSDQVGKRKDL